MIIAIILATVLVLFVSILYIHNHVWRREEASFYYIQGLYDDLQEAHAYLYDNKAVIEEVLEQQDVKDEQFEIVDRLHKITTLIDNLAYGVNNGILSRKIYRHLSNWIKDIYDRSRGFIEYMKRNYGDDAFEDISTLIAKDFKED